MRRVDRERRAARKSQAELRCQMRKRQAERARLFAAAEPPEPPGPHSLVLVHVMRGGCCYERVREVPTLDGRPCYHCAAGHVVRADDVATVRLEPPDPQSERLVLPATPYWLEAPTVAAPIVYEVLR